MIDLALISHAGTALTIVLGVVLAVYLVRNARGWSRPRRFMLMAMFFVITIGSAYLHLIQRG